jgi:arginine decarboxylase
LKDERILEGWTVRDSLDLYDVALWSGGYFSINDEGHLIVCPHRNGGPSIDLQELVEDLRERGHSLPLLLRFGDILRERVREIAECFRQAIGEYEYGGAYQGVFPIKVNQQHQVVEELLRYGNEFHLGLEVGSKPEMLVALALLDDPDALLVCNGYKDEAYVEMALLAQKLGRRSVLVIDRYRDLELILAVSRRTGIRPRLGVRAKLQAKGAGRWAESGGSRSKFGLTSREIVRVARRLEEEEMLDCLELLHFHMGSQVPSIRIFKAAVREGARFFVELHRMGAPMKYFDVGGGLAVDYDGSKTNFHSSMNYTIQEYANDVVTGIQEACDAQDVPHPVIVTESGRALVAHHTVLVFDVLDTNKVTVPQSLEPLDDDAPDVVRRLHETWGDIHVRNLREPYHDALQLRDEAYQLFNLGFLDLEGRALAERLFFACCTRVAQFLDKLPEVPEELEGLERGLADTYYCNFSVFQSMPDSWAVGQLFPIMPIHRLTERPDRRATLVDLTCDSDGKIDKFVDIRDVKRSLDLHDPAGRPYYLGAFLIGAYQEILGDLHNLFGDTHAIHVGLVGDRYRIEHVQAGDTVAEVLDYVEFDRRDLLQRVQRACEDALWAKTISPAETARLLKRYEEELNAYTYLVEGESGASTPKPN